MRRVAWRCGIATLALCLSACGGREHRGSAPVADPKPGAQPSDHGKLNSDWWLTERECPVAATEPPSPRASWDIDITDDPKDPDDWGQESLPPIDPKVREHLVNALDADKRDDLAVCIEEDRKALAIVVYTRSLLHLASCEARSHKLIDALRHARQALTFGVVVRDEAAVKLAKARVRELSDRIPKLDLIVAVPADLVLLTLDGVKVGGASGVPIAVDPGDHVVAYCGKMKGVATWGVRRVEAKEGAVLVVTTPL